MTLAAIGQICSTASIKGNLEQCVRLVGKAARGGAKVLFLPEASDYIATDAQASRDLAVAQSSSPFVLGLQDAAKTNGVAIHVGIHHRPVPAQVPGEKGEDSKAAGRILNRAIYIAADGSIDDSNTYDKLHVFDYGSLRESATVQPGSKLTAPFDSPVGRIGSLICFDLRFPEAHNPKRASYGRSIAVDPWGKVAVRLKGVTDAEGSADEGAVEEIGFFDVDLDEVDRVRREMPLLRRIDVYSEV
ncbi:unnamed protein product [Clonostachys rosea f. rosea IK726]|uniref:CN hydrolase domain-containing protein n=2 Tax=Bionectria ochroleuca TaxID=29856 RepID=A0A0B7JT33_BIOOC|nr:unnamed protein product [Clonostachys rosea f. rosea IK726]